MASSKVFIVFVFCNIIGEPFSNGNLVSTATKLQQRGSRQTLENETATCAEGQKGLVHGATGIAAPAVRLLAMSVCPSLTAMLEE